MSSGEPATVTVSRPSIWVAATSTADKPAASSSARAVRAAASSRNVGLNGLPIAVRGSSGSSMILAGRAAASSMCADAQPISSRGAGAVTRFQHDVSSRHFTRPAVRPSHRADSHHRGMTEQGLLDDHRVDVVASPDDHVLGAALEKDGLVLIDRTQVACSQPTVDDAIPAENLGRRESGARIRRRPQGR